MDGHHAEIIRVWHLLDRDASGAIDRAELRGT